MASRPEMNSEGPEVANWDHYLQPSPRSDHSCLNGRLSSGNIETLSSPSCDRTLFGSQISPGVDSLEDGKYNGAFFDQSGGVSEQPFPKQGNRVCGIPRRWLIAMVGALICILIVVGVVLGISLSKKGEGNNPSSQQDSQSSNSSLSLEQTNLGAANGSGVAVAGQSFDSGGHGETVLYFQHHSGQIRSTVLQSDGTWQGGTVSEIVAVNAKNATPISAVSYSMNGTNTWHIFYIGSNNTVLERVSDNSTNTWRDGPISRLGLQAMDDRNVGLQACWYGNYYGSPSYNKSIKASDKDLNIGMHLWYGSTSAQLEEAVWVYGADEWSLEKPLYGYNGHAGIACFSWGDDSITYVMLVNLQAQLEIWWKDLNTTKKSSPRHPINTWQNSSISIPHLQPNTSLGYTNYLFMQHNDNTISGYNISWAAENSTIVKKDTFSITDAEGNKPKGIPGTHFTNTALPNKSGGASVYAFFQMNGTDVTEWQRDMNGGQWFSYGIPIPDE